MKIYMIPKFSRTLTKVLKDGGWEVSRNSKNVITITRSDLVKTSYAMHLDFDARCVTTINLRTRCSGFKDVTIPIVTADMKVLIRLEDAFNKMLQTNELSELKVEVADDN